MPQSLVRSSRRASPIRRLAAWVAASACDPRTGDRFVAGFVLLHVVLWTVILTVLKRGQDIHFDAAEAYAWGQQALLGYGKHPPLSGWVAGVWFRLFPVADWASYALAMAVTGFGIWVCWRIALRIVDRRRAVLSVAMLALYPIFNVKGYKYNADLLQVATLPLLVLAYLDAFDKRNVWSGVLLGLAGTTALMTEYWALTMIGAIGLAALLHPERLRFLRSPVPWVAIATMLVTMAPHLWWLKQVDFLPLTYAGDSYETHNRWRSLHSATGYLGHNFALLLLPVLLAALAVRFVPVLAPWRWRAAHIWANWSRAPSPAVRIPEAIQIWAIQIIVAFGPPLGGIAFAVLMKTDWGIPLFFLTPLAIVAMPALRLPRIAVVQVVVAWLVLTVGFLLLTPRIVSYNIAHKAQSNPVYQARSELARELTNIWRMRFGTRWAVVAGPRPTVDLMAFYSIDHPVPFTPYEKWSSGLMTLAQASRSGYIGICDPTSWDHKLCRDWMKANVPDAFHLDISTRRFFSGVPGPVVNWAIYLVAPTP